VCSPLSMLEIQGGLAHCEELRRGLKAYQKSRAGAERRLVFEFFIRVSKVI